MKFSWRFFPIMLLILKIRIAESELMNRTSIDHKLLVNEQYFTNECPPKPTVYTINRFSPEYSFFRIDFEAFNLGEEGTGGNCSESKMVITGNEDALLSPPLCGNHTGQHLYVFLGEGDTSSPNLRIENPGPNSVWKIRTSQIKCGDINYADIPHVKVFASDSPPKAVEYSIDRISKEYCQVKFDFELFSVGEKEGDQQCGEEYLKLTGYDEEDGIVPDLCGTHTGHKVYVNFEEEDPSVRMKINPDSKSTWIIKTTQIKCDEQILSPQVKIFTNEGEPKPVEYFLERLSEDYCQVKIYFKFFSVGKKSSDGTCGKESWHLSGYKRTRNIPTLCGSFSNQKLFAGFEDSGESIQMKINPDPDSYWRIKTRQIECSKQILPKNVKVYVNDSPPEDVEYDIERLSNDSCQVKIDFEVFSVGRPEKSGLCGQSYWELSGYKEDRNVPKLCGVYSGHYLYAEFRESEPKMKMTIKSNSKCVWRIRVTQIKCGTQIVFPTSHLFVNDVPPRSVGFTIEKSSDKFCKIRFEFEAFSIGKVKSSGKCEQSYWELTGYKKDQNIPKLCGVHTGQHIYADFDDSGNPMQLKIESDSNSFWKIRANQIECSNEKLPPHIRIYVSDTPSQPANYSIERLSKDYCQVQISFEDFAIGGASDQKEGCLSHYWELTGQQDHQNFDRLCGNGNWKDHKVFAFFDDSGKPMKMTVMPDSRSHWKIVVTQIECGKDT